MKNFFFTCLLLFSFHAEGQKIVAYVPTLSDSCPYARVMMEAMDLYFAKGYALEGLTKDKLPEVVFVVHDEVDWGKLGIYSFKILPDKKGKVFRANKIDIPKTKNSDAVVQLFDHSGSLAYVAFNYRGQGEKLRPLEKEIRSQLDLAALGSDERMPGSEPTIFKTSESDDLTTLPQPLKVGDKSPEFSPFPGQTLAELCKKGPVIISFYPAPFTGYIPTSSVFLSNYYLRDVNLLSCSGQISTMDYVGAAVKSSKINSEPIQALKHGLGRKIDSLTTPSLDNFKAQIYMVSSSSTPILEAWKRYLGTQTIEYVNDPDYSMAKRFQSYNFSLGYDARTVFIIDRDGNIAYINWDYKVDNPGFQEIRNKLGELLRK
jgi:peroxiredoxin